VGLTVQNLGVEAPRVLGVGPERRADPLALPSMEGWTWLTLRGVPDDEALEAAVAVAAAATGTRALAYSVDDSDSAYVVGATPAGLAFVVSVGGANQSRQIERAAAFASVQIAPIDEALAPSYVFAEEGVHALFAAMGVGAPARHAPETMAVEADEDEDEEDEDEAAFVNAIRGNREGRRWAARAEIPFGGRWVLVAAEAAPPGGLAASFCSRRDRMVVVSDDRDVQELRAWITEQDTGVVLGPWHEIPEDVPRSLHATITWALDRLR
jgi:hypothetical protein